MEEPLAALEELVTAGDPAGIHRFVEAQSDQHASYLLARLSNLEVVRLVKLLSESDNHAAATVLQQLPVARAARILETLDPAAAAPLFQELPSNEGVDLIRTMARDEAQTLLQALSPDHASRMKRLISYDEGSAGGLMIDEYIAHRVTSSVEDVVKDLRRQATRYAKFDVQYVYVTSEEGHLEGVVRLRDLLLTPDEEPLRSVMIPAPESVSVHQPVQALEAFFDTHHFFAAPVLDERGVLVGVVRRAAVEEARAEEADRAFLAFGGIIGGEELRTMPNFQRIVRRLAFLCPNILLNLIAASVIAVYEPTIAAVTALAIFLPMLSDMSGCAGNQAVAVSIRELSLGVLRPSDLVLALKKEVTVGLVNGVVLGSMIGGVAWLMRGDEYTMIGPVVGAAMCLNSVVAVTVGGTIPLVLKRAGVDPALAASPILTTFTDMIGFFLTLSFASAFILG